MDRHSFRRTSVAEAHWKQFEPHTEGFYSNDAYDQSQKTLSRSYRGNFDRLLATKNKCDPNNQFRLNSNTRTA